jgi:hypothetical protein
MVARDNSLFLAPLISSIEKQADTNEAWYRVVTRSAVEIRNRFGVSDRQAEGRIVELGKVVGVQLLSDSVLRRSPRNLGVPIL